MPSLRVEVARLIFDDTYADDEWSASDHRAWLDLARRVIDKVHKREEKERVMKPDDSERGFYGKYVISKADGSPVDPAARYFVLRYDKEMAARMAMLEYAFVTTNEALGRDLLVLPELAGLIDEYEPPALRDTARKKMRDDLAAILVEVRKLNGLLGQKENLHDTELDV